MTEIQFISIASRWDSDRILYRGQHATLREALLAAIANGANLSNANLSDANLSGADLSGADLRNANLRNANLSNANLSNANLRNANLSNANLSDANLSDANLRNADLRNADLRNANLSGAYLPVPDLAKAKADLWSIFDLVPNEVPAVRVAIVDGKINGSVYEGSCACLVGTIANARGCYYGYVPGVRPDADRPAEAFFYSIRPGHVPAINYHAALAVMWIDEWMSARKAEVSDGR